MGNRALIAKLTEENTVEYIYVHGGGYVEVLNDLTENYRTEEKVDALLDRGSSSCFDENHYNDGDSHKREFANLGRFMKEANDSYYPYSFLWMHGAWTLINYNGHKLEEVERVYGRK